MIQALLWGLEGRSKGEDVLAFLKGPNVSNCKRLAVSEKVRLKLYIMLHVPWAQKVTTQLMKAARIPGQVLSCGQRLRHCLTTIYSSPAKVDRMTQENSGISPPKDWVDIYMLH
jgi:hypothetical protein